MTKHKIVIKTLKNTFALSLPVFIWLGLMASQPFMPLAHAATTGGPPPPAPFGCYIVQQGTNQVTGPPNVTCPSGNDSTSQPINGQINCYLASASTDSKGNQVVGTYVPQSCQTLSCTILNTSNQYTCPPGTECANSSANQGCAANCGASCSTSIITNYLNPVINFLSVGVGIIITIMIVVGGIQYAASGGDPNGVAAAKKRIINAVIALVAFGLAYAILQFIVPNGLFK